MMMSRFMDFLSNGLKRAPRVIPTISLKVLQKEYSAKGFAAPNPDITEAIHDLQGNVVGSTVYSVSPLADRVYLFAVEIAPPFRRKGYGLALLKSLAKTYGLPITVVQPISPALLFWESARKELGDILPMTQSLSVSDMDMEKSRWAHLQPIIDRLEQTILERHLRGEPYAQAVGRGLEDAD
jgi:GNAT superfamily N-acetyltransferase